MSILVVTLGAAVPGGGDLAELGFEARLGFVDALDQGGVGGRIGPIGHAGDWS
jgi:hypothetical protein